METAARTGRSDARSEDVDFPGKPLLSVIPRCNRRSACQQRRSAMTHPVIRVEKLGKRYVLGRQQRGPRSRALGEDLTDAAKAPVRWAQRLFGVKSEWNAANDGESVSPWFTPRRLRVADATGTTLTSVLANDEEAWPEIEAEVAQLDPALNVGYAIYTGANELVYWSCHTDASPATPLRPAPGRNLLYIRLPRRLLNEGMYRVELIGSVHHLFWIFEVQGGLSESPLWNSKRPGLLAPVLPWETAA